jgi:hypothetical protein
VASFGRSDCLRKEYGDRQGTGASPGTGVINHAGSAAEPYSTSPTFQWLYPASMTKRPRLDPLTVNQLGPPDSSDDDVGAGDYLV